MLRFFRFNDPYRLIFVLITVGVLGIKAEFEVGQITVPEFNGVLVGEMMADGKRMYSEVWHSMPPVAAYVQYLLDLAFERSLTARHITSLLLIFFQASMFGVLLIINRAFNESNYLPAFVFAFLSFFSFDTPGLTGELIGSTVLLLAINNLLREIEFKRQRDETIHNLGFYIGVASLAVFSHIVFFFGVALVLFVFTRVELRRLGLYVIGFLLPHFFVNLWYFHKGDIDWLWSNFYLANIDFNSQSLVGLKGLIILAAIPLSYFLFSLVMMRRDARLTKYQSQIVQVMFLWLAFGLIETYLNKLRTPQTLLVFVPPLAYFISHYFLLIRRKWIAELMIWIFMVGLVSVNSLSARNMIYGFDPTRIYVQVPNATNFSGKKILVFEDSLSPYLENRTSAYFLDWKLSQTIFNEPDIYQHVLLVSEAFDADPPDVILDRKNSLKGILAYLPKIQEKYRREGDYYIRIP